MYKIERVTITNGQWSQTEICEKVSTILNETREKNHGKVVSVSQINGQEFLVTWDIPEHYGNI